MLKLKLFLGLVAAVLWPVSYLAAEAVTGFGPSWHGFLSAVTFAGAACATFAAVAVHIVDLTENQKG